VLHVIHDFEEGHGFTRDSFTGLDHRGLHVDGVALAASTVEGTWLTHTLLGLAGWLLAHELALGAGAQSGLLALPVALGLLAHRSAHSIGSSACGTALSRSTDSLALGAVIGLAQILGATNIALRLVAMNLAGGTGGLLAMNLALRALAHRVALSRARGVITLPSALRVALCWCGSWGLVQFHFAFHLHGRGRGEEEGGHKGEQNIRYLHIE